MKKSRLGLAVLVAAALSLVGASTAMAAPPVATNPTINVTAGDPQLIIPVSQIGTDPDGNTVSIYQLTVGAPCLFQDTTHIKYTPPLTAGQQTCTVRLTDGNSSPVPPVISTVTFVIAPIGPPPDTEAPVVEITSPQDGDDYAVDTVSLAYTVTDNTTDTSPTCDLLNGSDVTLTEGANEITVSCTDAAGNTGTDTVNVTYTPVNVAPTVDITSPSDGDTVSTSSVQLDYIAGDDSGDPPSCDKTSGGQVTLQPGVNVITVTCTDQEGLASSDSVSVTYTQLPPPTLTVSPAVVTEGDPGMLPVYAEFLVTLSHPTDEDVDVAYWALPGTAGVGDFQSNILLPKSVTIPAGQTTTVITVKITADTKRELTELFFLLYISCDLNTVGVTTGTIRDDANG